MSALHKKRFYWWIRLLIYRSLISVWIGANNHTRLAGATHHTFSASKCSRVCIRYGVWRHLATFSIIRFQLDLLAANNRRTPGHTMITWMRRDSSVHWKGRRNTSRQASRRDRRRERIGNAVIQSTCSPLSVCSSFKSRHWDILPAWSGVLPADLS
jgi:hypothetical protein